LVVRDLAVGKSRIADRLNKAAPELINLKDKNFPEKFPDDFLWIKESLTKKPAAVFQPYYGAGRSVYAVA